MEVNKTRQTSRGSSAGRAPVEQARVAKHNVSRIARLVRDQQETATRSERISGAISRFVGSLWFVTVHVLVLGAWAVWNVTAPAAWRFDPFPFMLLTMFVSLEGVLVATFVLVTQNRLSQQADRRDHLHIQINLMAEQETTQVLRMLRQIAAHLQISEVASDAVSEQLEQDTDVHELLREIDRQVPTE